MKRMEGIHTIQNKKSTKRNPVKERIFLQKRDILFQRERASTLPGGKYLQGLLSHLDKNGMWCKKFRAVHTSLQYYRQVFSTCIHYFLQNFLYVPVGNLCFPS